MLALDNPTHTLEAILAASVAANQLHVTTTYRDVANPAGSDLDPGISLSTVKTNGATAVTALAAPTQSVRREIENITVHNADTSSATITLRINDGTNTYTMMKVVMATLYTLVFERASGWTLYNASGVRQ